MEKSKWPKRSFVFHPSLEIPFPVAPEMNQAVFDDGVSYKPSSDDVFVCTYPKSGTTWMTYALLIMRNDNKVDEDEIRLYKEIPFLEYLGKSAVDAVTERPRIIKSHLMFQMIPMNSKTKYIYIARNPKDCIVSYYFHVLGFAHNEWPDGKFNDFFDMFMAGEAEFGDYFESVGEWFKEAKTRENVCLLLYEDMKEDFEKEFLRVAEFLGSNWTEKLLKNDKLLLRKVVEDTSFNAMKTGNILYTHTARDSNLSFIRKGEVADWKNYLSKEQSDLVDEKLKETAKRYPGFDKLWEKYGCL